HLAVGELEAHVHDPVLLVRRQLGALGRHRPEAMDLRQATAERTLVEAHGLLGVASEVEVDVDLHELDLLGRGGEGSRPRKVSAMSRACGPQRSHHRGGTVLPSTTSRGPVRRRSRRCSRSTQPAPEPATTPSAPNAAGRDAPVDTRIGELPSGAIGSRRGCSGIRSLPPHSFDLWPTSSQLRSLPVGLILPRADTASTRRRAPVPFADTSGTASSTFRRPLPHPSSLITLAASSHDHRLPRSLPSWHGLSCLRGPHATPPRPR